MEWDETFWDDSWTILKDEEELAQERTVWERKNIVITVQGTIMAQEKLPTNQPKNKPVNEQNQIELENCWLDPPSW